MGNIVWIRIVAREVVEFPSLETVQDLIGLTRPQITKSKAVLSRESWIG